MLRRKNLWLYLLLVTGLLMGSGARAAISVTGLAVTGTGAPYDVVYTLNADAVSGQVEFLNSGGTVVRTVTLSGADLSRGTHHYLWDGKNTGGANAPAGQYRARVSAAAAAVPSTGALLWGPQDVASQSAPVRFGVAVNTNPASPYYGRIYVSDYSNDTVRGYTADGTKVLDLTYPDFPAGVRGLYVGADDRLYANVQSDSSVGTGVAAGIISFLQDGTDPVREVNVQDQPRQMVVTGTGANRRFYYGQATNQTTGPGNVLYQTPGNDSPFVLLSIDNDAIFAGTVDGIVVLDNQNDPAGHANNTTIYVRTNATNATTGQSIVSKWDNNSADPTVLPYTRDASFSGVLPQPATPGYTGAGLTRAPDGSLWTSVSHATTSIRGYYQLNGATGAQMAVINPVPTKPRYVAADAKGNVVGVLLPDATSSNWGKQLAMFAPPDSGSTDATTSAAFAVSGVVLPPIVITNGPTVADRTSTTATITWTTDVASSTEIQYGPSETSLPNTVTVDGNTTNHSVTITGLTKTTPYFFKVRSAATGFATVESAIQSFTTKDVLAITNVAATAASTTATVTWTTDKPTNSTVLYGTSPDALNLSATGNADATSHTVNISGLTPGVTYYFVAQSMSDTAELTTSAPSFFATLHSSGYRYRVFSENGHFKFGLLDDVVLTGGGLKANAPGIPSGVDDAAVPDLPEAKANHAVVAYGGYLYAIGGRHPSINKNIVYYAPISENVSGTVGAWKETAPLTDDRYFLPHAGFGYNGYIYVVGGGTPTTQLTTLYARQNPLDGSLGPWAVAGTFPKTYPDPLGGADIPGERDYGAVAVIRGRVYYTAGEDNTGTFHNNTYVADIKPDGTLSAWTVATELLPVNVFQHAMEAHGGRLYLWGGEDDLATLQVGVYQTTPTEPALGINPWQTSGPGLFEGRSGFASGIVHNVAVMVGGNTGGARTDKITYAPIETDGSIGTWTDSTVTYSTDLPLRDMDAAEWGGRLYVVGGRSSDTGPSFDPNAKALAAAVNFTGDIGTANNATYESPIIDLGVVEPLKSLTLAKNGNVVMVYRTADADGVFGAWQSVPADLTGVSARYVQFALTLNGPSVSVTGVALAYGTGTIPYTVTEVRRALQIALGGAIAQSIETTRLDINGDGSVTLADAVTINRSLAGL